jgi:Fe-S-cluster containining protein
MDSATETIGIGTDRVTIIDTKPNGECRFYSRHAGKGVCDIYKNRPDVCKTYPFRLARKENRLTVYLLPCLGLNTKKGNLLNENFFSKYLRFADAA